MTIKSIPNWVMLRYSALFREFRSSKTFSRKEAQEVIKKYQLKDDEKLTNTFFSELHKRGWVEVKQDKEDKRKKSFKLVNPEKAILNLELTE